MDPSFSPQLCVGFLFLILYPECSARLLCPPASSNTHFLSRIIFHTTHLTHISHRSLSHIIFHTTHLTHIFVHHYLVHHHLCHTSHTHLPHLTHISHMSHIIFHTTHLTHIFVHHHLCHTSHTHLPHISHTSLSTAIWSTTIFVTHLGDAAALCVAGVALGDIHLPFVWQAWHLETSNCHLRGRCGTGDTGLGLVARLDRIGRAVTPRHFAWQVWHSATSTYHLRGRR